MLNFLKDYISKEASIADWMAGFGTLLVAVIALWPNLSKIFIKYLFPKIEINISGDCNIVISQDGSIHKLQIPLQFENKGRSRSYIEHVQVIIRGQNREKFYLLDWHKFIADLEGRATVPLSNPYRFQIEPKDFQNRFIQFWTEDNIKLVKGEQSIEVKVDNSYANKIKTISRIYKLNIDEKKFQEVEKTINAAIKNKRWFLVGIEV